MKYRNDPKFFGRTGLANSADPDKTALRGDQTAPSLIRFYTVCHSVCIFWMHNLNVKQPCSNFRVITANFPSVQIFWIFMVLVLRYIRESLSIRSIPEK